MAARITKKNKELESFLDPGPVSQEPSQTPEKPRRKGTFRKIFQLIVILICVGVAAYFYYQYRSLKNDPGKIAREEVHNLVKEIGELMQLPGGEEPTLATVTDRDRLKEQPFFSASENGDKVLIYAKAKKAILFRPSSSKIIEVAPLVSSKAGGEKAENAAPMPAAEEKKEQAIEKTYKVAIMNGTEIRGYTSELEKKIASVEKIEVTEKTNAAKTDYLKTLVVDLVGDGGEKAKQLAEKLEGEVAGNLPDGEARPSADILIIGGVGL